MRIELRILWVVLLALMLFSMPCMARPRKDVIFFKNGDRWTCEIMKLDRAYLYVKLDYVDGTVSVDWAKVSKLESEQLFLVRDSAGEIFEGPIHTPPAATETSARPAVAVGIGQRVKTLPDTQVVSIEQTENNFFHGLNGDINGGFSFAKSNSQTQYSFDSSTHYIREHWAAQATFSSSFTSTHSAHSNLREDLGFMATRDIVNRQSFLFGVTSWQKNDEQQLNSRYTLGPGFGHLIRDTDRLRIYWLAGAGWTREKYQTEENQVSTTNSAVGLAGMNFQYFQFKTTNYQLKVTSYPSLSDPGRVRVDANATVKFRIAKDLYWNFSTYLNYDSRPPQATTKSDYGLTSSLGWTF